MKPFLFVGTASFFIYMSVQILKISCKWLIFAENAGISTGLSGIYGKVSAAVA